MSPLPVLTNILPYPLLAPPYIGDVGGVAPPNSVVVMYADGVNTDWLAVKLDVNAQRLIAASYPYNSPIFWVPC